jgi:hypothetical protein
MIAAAQFPRSAPLVDLDAELTSANWLTADANLVRESLGSAPVSNPRLRCGGRCGSEWRCRSKATSLMCRQQPAVFLFPDRQLAGTGLNDTVGRVKTATFNCRRYRASTRVDPEVTLRGPSAYGPRNIV